MATSTPSTGGILAFAGGTDWAQLGRTGGKQKKDESREDLYPNLCTPQRLKALLDIKIAFVAGGPAAVHCIVGDVDGRLYTWGRNEKGQLGHGDLVNRNTPTVVKALSQHFVVGGSGGRNHSAFLLKGGDCYTVGLNTHGQCGTGSIKKGVKEDVMLQPARALVAACSQVACGMDFTLWLSEGKVLAAGCGQYGTLGDGTDHSYNAKESSISIQYEPVHTPQVVSALTPHTIITIAAGQQHCLAVDNAGSCYSWGNGGYCRLGHKIQQDEHRPRRIETFSNRMAVPKENVVVAASSTASFCMGPGGQMYQWGKTKVSGESLSFPQAVMDLSGWNVRSFACGAATFAVAADNSVITWGMAHNGELGLGPTGKKSSANPCKVNALEGGLTHQVGAGLGFTLFLLDPAHPALDKLEVFHSTAPDAPSPSVEAAGEEGGEGTAKGGSKRKAPVVAAATKAKKGKAK